MNKNIKNLINKININKQCLIKGSVVVGIGAIITMFPELLEASNTSASSLTSSSPDTNEFSGTLANMAHQGLAILSGDVGQLVFLGICGFKVVQSLMSEKIHGAVISIAIFILYQWLINYGMNFIKNVTTS